MAAVCFICYWLIGLPLGIMLALVLELNTKGMWIGISLAGGIQVRTDSQYPGGEH